MSNERKEKEGKMKENNTKNKIKMRGGGTAIGGGRTKIMIQLSMVSGLLAKNSDPIFCYQEGHYFERLHPHRNRLRETGSISYLMTLYSTWNLEHKKCIYIFSVKIRKY